MKGNFSFKTESLDVKKLRLSIFGYLNEDSVLPDDLVNVSELTELHVDFKNLEFINSTGIKLWISFVSNLEENPSLKIYFHNCRTIIVNQINLIYGFLPKNAEVCSVYVPVYCSSCDSSYDILYDIVEGQFDEKKVAEKIMDKAVREYSSCERNLELDIVPRLYFKFLKE